jgi:type II secretory pathway component PulM
MWRKIIFVGVLFATLVRPAFSQAPQQSQQVADMKAMQGVVNDLFKDLLTAHAQLAASEQRADALQKQLDEAKKPPAEKKGSYPARGSGEKAS